MFYLSGPKWRKRWAILRQQVLDRDGWRCCARGRPGRLEVDHIRPRFLGGDDWDVDNLQTLCRPCHFEKTRLELVQRHQIAREARQSPEKAALTALVEEIS